ncbi:MAG: hypothetical protein KGJ88_05765 [Verrucomicrobiota bacterium]|nr:hypothetical protein [Verrucomicrobiota bacterium]
MKTTWLGIYDRGNIANERVHFRALADIDLQFCAIVDTQYQTVQGLIEVNNKNCFWFSPYPVKAGQNVVVYTRAGVPNFETRADGSMFHFFFRGLGQPLYQPVHRCAVLLEINSWITTAWGS